MRDLAEIEESDAFDLDPTTAARVAFVHLSPRMALRRRNDDSWQLSSHFPGLGLLNLALALRVDAEQGRLRGAVDVRYFDEECWLDDTALVDEVGSWLAASRRPMLGMSAYTWNITELESFLGKFDPTRVLRIVGGPHATLAPDVDSVHLVVRGEGGAALRHIVNTFGTVEFGEHDEAKGICLRRGDYSRLGKLAYDRSLESLPSPGFAYDLLPRSEPPVYTAGLKRIVGERPQIYICTQSCRARCTFCSTYLIHGRAVARPVDLIAADLDFLVRKLGHDSLEFHDDDLLQHPEFDQILDVLAALRVPWFCYGRVSTITPDVGARMGAAGCARVFLGVEAMDQQTLDYFNKQTTVEQNRVAVHALDSAGVGVVAGFILGAPHHTVEGLLADLDRFLELPLLFLNVTVLSPDPGTIEFRRARRRSQDLPAVSPYGLRLLPDPDRFGEQAPYGLPTVCAAVPKDVLNELADYAEIRFCLRPEQDARFEAHLPKAPQRRLLHRYRAGLLARAEQLTDTAQVPEVAAGCAMVVGARRGAAAQAT